MPYDEDENFILPEANKTADTQVPLSVQRAALESVAGPTGLLTLIRFCIDNWSDIVHEARVRLDEGYRQFGSGMYAWEPERRRHEIVTELADAICYLSSGEV